MQLEDEDAGPFLTEMQPFMTIITPKYTWIYNMMSDYPSFLNNFYIIFIEFTCILYQYTILTTYKHRPLNFYQLTL